LGLGGEDYILSLHFLMGMQAFLLTRPDFCLQFFVVNTISVCITFM